MRYRTKSGAPVRGPGIWMLAVLLLGCAAAPARAQQRQVHHLTLESAVDLAMGSSYRVRQLKLGIDRTRSLLRAERAGLKSRVALELATPEIAAISDNKWNSDLRRYEIVRENSRMWRMNVSLRQPVILFGYPTNGYLSLNNQIYRYTQIDSSARDVSYYNRYFIRYEQPLFQPNRLKNAIEEAELDLERAELAFQADVVNLVDDLAGDYYRLFELAFREKFYQEHAERLERAFQIARHASEADTSRGIEAAQAQVELANARERVRQTQGNFRLEAAQMKQRLDLSPGDSLVVDPVLDVRPVAVDIERAVEFGKTLRPQLRQLEISRRKGEIDLETVRGTDSFRANLELTYGRETQDPVFTELWEEPTNSYTVGLRAYLPIWDWGRRRARIQAEKISLQRTELAFEEAEKEIRLDIMNAVQNLNEYSQRAATMRDNLEVARGIVETTLQRYEAGSASILELLQSVSRQTDTAQNFLEAYLGYRRALLSLQELTFYDFEHDRPLIQRFRDEGLQ